MSRDFAAFERIFDAQSEAVHGFPAFTSQTSRLFLVDVMRQACAKAAEGELLIEVGCFMGSSTAALALLAQWTGTTLYSIDISRRHIDITADLLTHLGLREYVVFFCGDFPSFARKLLLPRRPVMVLVDGHHGYRFVRADIEALFALSDRPRFAAFHDYALRHAETPTPDTPNVPGAIHDMFGANPDLIPIGIVGPERPEINEIKNYLAPGVPEGVIIDLAPYPGGPPGAARG